MDDSNMELPDEQMVTVRLTVDGRRRTILAPSRESLADALRHRCHIRSIHLGCEHGVCGACTVVLDGRTARSCLVLAAQANGSTVATVDGLAVDGSNPLQRAFSELHALQCGFCTPGFLLAAKELLEQHPEPSRLTGLEVREHLSGNICRCTGYHNIVAAVLRIAGAQPESTAAPTLATEVTSR